MTAKHIIIRIGPERRAGFHIAEEEGHAERHFSKLRRAFDYIRNLPGDGSVCATVLDAAGGKMLTLEVARAEL